MSDLEHLEILKLGVPIWNDWRKKNPNIIPDLRGADFCQSNLIRANLADADLQETNFFETVLYETNFSGANLRGANLKRTVLINANFSGTPAAHTNLANADLSYSWVHGVTTTGADLRGSNQLDLVVTPPGPPVLTVDNLRLAEYIYDILYNKKIAYPVDTMALKCVLIVGRFTKRHSLLEFIRSELRCFGFLPIAYDFETPTIKDMVENINILAQLSLFMIAELSNPNYVSQNIDYQIPDYQVPLFPIIQTDQPLLGFQENHLKKYSWSLPLIEYRDVQDLMSVFESWIVKPARNIIEKTREFKLHQIAEMLAGKRRARLI